jgi:arabinan endo-1,5-alpha-L-arabinosidase
MNLGGGSVSLETDKNWHGVGYNAVTTFNGMDYLVFHRYDASDNGKSKLRIEKLNWKNGWAFV